MQMILQKQFLETRETDWRRYEKTPLLTGAARILESVTKVAGVFLCSLLNLAVFKHTLLYDQMLSYQDPKLKLFSQM